MVAAETSRKPRSMAESSAPSVSNADSSARDWLGTCAYRPGLHTLCGVPDEGQDYQLRIQQNRTCITSYAPYQLGNIEPKPHDQHMQDHMDKGDFKRWGARGQGGGQ